MRYYMDEEAEATMLHTNAIVERETMRWDERRDTMVDIAYHPPGTSDLTGSVPENKIDLIELQLYTIKLSKLKCN